MGVSVCVVCVGVGVCVRACVRVRVCVCAYVHCVCVCAYVHCVCVYVYTHLFANTVHIGASIKWDNIQCKWCNGISYSSSWNSPQ